MEMIELTDADRDAINAERVRVFVDLPAWERRYVNWDETLYRAGLAAGIEQADRGGATPTGCTTNMHDVSP